MTQSKPCARSIAIALCLALLASALTACKSNSTRPSPAPTPPPPVVSCDHTPPPALLPPVPVLLSLADLPAMDEWILQALGVYTGEVTIRRGEHACMDQLRKGGAIR